MNTYLALLGLAGLLFSCQDIALDNPYDPQSSRYDGGPPGLATIEPPGRETDSSLTVTLGGTEGSTLYYTLDGSEPSLTTGVKYTVPLGITSSTIVKVIAYKPGYPAGPVSSGRYILRCRPVEIGAVVGYLTPTTPVTVLSPTPDVAVLYTTDGTDPLTEGSVANEGKIYLPAGTSQLRAVATKEGLEPSPEASKSLTALTLVQNWEFDSSVEGWMKPNDALHVSALEWADDGSLQGTIVGSDPRVWSPKPLALDLSSVAMIEFRLKNSTSGIQGSLYWSTTTQTWSGAASTNFVVIPDSEYTVYQIAAPTTNDTFKGTLTQWRLDPENSGGSGAFSLDYFRVFSLIP